MQHLNAKKVAVRCTTGSKCEYSNVKSGKTIVDIADVCFSEAPLDTMPLDTYLIELIIFLN